MKRRRNHWAVPLAVGVPAGFAAGYYARGRKRNGRSPKEGQIVVAWTEETMRYTGKPYRHDLGERPEMVADLEPKAAMWLRSGTAEDVAKAQAFVARDHGGRAFVYPATERDPLGRARREILKMARSARNPGERERMVAEIEARARRRAEADRAWWQAKQRGEAPPEPAATPAQMEREWLAEAAAELGLRHPTPALRAQARALFRQQRNPLLVINPTQHLAGARPMSALPAHVRNSKAFRAAVAAYRARYRCDPDVFLDVDAPRGSGKVLAGVGPMTQWDYLARNAPGEQMTSWYHPAGELETGDKLRPAWIAADPTQGGRVFPVDPRGSRMRWRNAGIVG